VPWPGPDVAVVRHATDGGKTLLEPARVDERIPWFDLVALGRVAPPQPLLAVQADQRDPASTMEVVDLNPQPAHPSPRSARRRSMMSRSTASSTQRAKSPRRGAAKTVLTGRSTPKFWLTCAT